MEVYYSSHSVYRTEYHIVFTTKYRRKALNLGFAKYTEIIIRETVDTMAGCIIKELNVQPEHVHVIIIIPPRYAVSKVVEIIKTRSANKVRKKFLWLKEHLYYGTNSLWSTGYFVSTIGLNETVIRRYVRYQQNQDSGQAKLEF